MIDTFDDAFQRTAKADPQDTASVDLAEQFAMGYTPQHREEMALYRGLGTASIQTLFGNSHFYLPSEEQSESKN